MVRSKANKQAKVFFVTGTDTDAGKTYISSGLLEAANLAGLSSAAIKPIAAGGVVTEDGFKNDDALALQQKCSLSLSYDEVNPVCLEPAIAPHIAALRVGRRVTVSQLAGFCRGVILKRADLTIIEGAGGWKVPLNNKELLSDLVRELKVPVILVVAMRLGCINHALLTVQAIQADGLEIAGWVANQSEPEMEAYAENLATLKEMISAPMLAEVKYETNFSLSSSCAKQLDIAALLED